MANRLLTNDKIKPLWNSAVTEILDVKLDKVTGVRLKNLISGQETVLACAGVFVAIGHVPNTRLFKGVIDMDDNGYIIPRRERPQTSPASSWPAIARTTSIARR